MKLYIILDNGKIAAMSEEKKDIQKYMKSKKYTDKQVWTSVKGKTADRLMVEFEDFYLEHDEKLDMVLTRMELKILDSILGEEKARLRSTIDDLQHYISDYKFSKKEKSILNKALKIIQSSKKTKRLKKLIDLEEFFGIMGKSKSMFETMREKIIETAQQMFIFINMKE